jgi:hypothetical protein
VWLGTARQKKEKCGKCIRINQFIADMFTQFRPMFAHFEGVLDTRICEQQPKNYNQRTDALMLNYGGRDCGQFYQLNELGRVGIHLASMKANGFTLACETH